MMPIFIRKICAISFLAVLIGCGQEQKDRSDQNERVIQLEDSLRAYRDTLASERFGWTFNTISTVVRTKEWKIKLGDTVHAEVMLTAWNEPSLDYKYHDPRLILDDPNVMMQKVPYGWHIAYIPSKIGMDSLIGSVKLRCQGCKETDSTENFFMTRYTVVP